MFRTPAITQLPGSSVLYCAQERKDSHDLKKKKKAQALKQKVVFSLNKEINIFLSLFQKENEEEEEEEDVSPFLFFAFG